jgi:hypothetical protein
MMILQCYSFSYFSYEGLSLEGIPHNKGVFSSFVYDCTENKYNVKNKHPYNNLENMTFYSFL